MMTRRLFQFLASGLSISHLSKSLASPNISSPWQISTFKVDVTCPIGHPCMGGGISNAKVVVDPLECRGVVIKNGDLKMPVVIASIDWCEIRNEAYDQFRDALAKAANTSREYVILTAIHQHDTPIADLYAEELLVKNGGIGSICMPDFFQKTIEKVAAAIKQSEMQCQNLTHIGTGQAQVKGVASNRRFMLPDGKPSFSRTSATRDEYARSQPEGTIDFSVTTTEMDKKPSTVAYHVVHVKRDDRWQMFDIFETAPVEDPASESHTEKLAALDSIVGEWVEETEAATVHHIVRWSPSHRYLLIDYRAETGSGKAVTVSTQRVGWDRKSRSIRSWLFEEDGGHGTAVWTPEPVGKGWKLKGEAVLADGRIVTGTTVMDATRPGQIQIRSYDRTADGEQVEDATIRTLVRKPPTKPSVKK